MTEPNTAASLPKSLDALLGLTGALSLILAFVSIDPDQFEVARRATPITSLAIIGSLLVAASLLVAVRRMGDKARAAAQSPAPQSISVVVNQNPSLVARSHTEPPTHRPDSVAAHEHGHHLQAQAAVPPPTVASNDRPQQKAYPPGVARDRADSIEAAFMGLSPTQKAIISTLYGLHKTQIGIDESFSLLTKKLPGQIGSADELYYRLKDLLNSSLLELKKIDPKLSSVLLLRDVASVLEARNHLPT